MIFYKLSTKLCEISDHRNVYSVPGVPVIFNDEGIFLVPSKFLMSLSLDEKDVRSSVRTYADHLLAFFKYIESSEYRAEMGDEKCKWNLATDRTLSSFVRSKQNQKKRASDKYIGQVIGTVFRFYRWAEQNKHIYKHVAIYDDDHDYAISARKNPKTGRWSWPYVPKAEDEFQPVPTNEDLETAHMRAFELSGKVGRRDTLLLSLYELSARRAEALQVKLDQIPSLDEIEEAICADKLFGIKVIGKGKVKRTISILPELAEQIRQYIECERAEIVAKCKKRDRTYKDPGLVFVSYERGLPLNPNYISTRISELLDIGTGHRVRAKGLTDIVAALDVNNEDGSPMAAKDILIRAAEVAGHKNPSSLRSYLASSRSADLASRVGAIQRYRVLENKIESQKRKLSNYEALSTLVEAIESGIDVSEEQIRSALSLQNAVSQN